MQSRPKHDHRRAIFGALVCTMLVLLTSARSGATPAQATCDPAYGCRPNPAPAPTPSCSVAGAGSFSPGDTVTATLTNVPVGTVAELRLDGAVVARGVATADGRGTQTASASQLPAAAHMAVAQTAYGGLVLTFRLPTDLRAGTHTLVFVGGGVVCDPTGGTGVAVLGNQASRGGTGGTSLARTGITIALYVAVALALLVVGANVVRAARRRRRKARRAAHATERPHERV